MLCLCGTLYWGPLGYALFVWYTVLGPSRLCFVWYTLLGPSRLCFVCVVHFTGALQAMLCLCGTLYWGPLGYALFVWYTVLGPSRLCFVCVVHCTGALYCVVHCTGAL